MRNAQCAQRQIPAAVRFPVSVIKAKQETKRSAININHSELNKYGPSASGASEMKSEMCVVCGKSMRGSTNKKKGCPVHKRCEELLIIH